MKKKIMTATILIIAIALICILSQACYANGIDFSGLQNIYNNSGDEAYQSIGGKIIGTVQFICYGAAVIIIILKGVKLMNAAPEAKADAKKRDDKLYNRSSITICSRIYNKISSWYCN